MYKVGAIMTKKRKGKTKKVKVASPDQSDNAVEIPCSDMPDSGENLIYVGGNCLYHESKVNKKHPAKIFKTFLDHANY